MGNTQISETQKLATGEYERCFCREAKKFDWESFRKLGPDEQSRFHPLNKALYRCQHSNFNRKDYPKLERYWRRTATGAEGRTHQYIACKDCITEEVKPYFTYHENGWCTSYKSTLVYENIPQLTKQPVI